MDDRSNTLGSTLVPAAAVAPVIPGDAPDPVVVYDPDDGEYHAFTTSAVTPGGWANVPQWRTVDLVSWTYIGDALPTRATWATGDPESYAPAVVRLAGRWVLYVSTSGPLGHLCIRRAEAGRLGDVFVDRSSAPIVCGIDDGNSAIDPSVHVAADGTAYLHWKNEGSSQIVGQRLDATGSQLVGPRELLLNPDADWIGTGVENPSMIVLATVHVLLFSAQFWETDRYLTAWAACAGPLGPCVSGAPMLQTGNGLPNGPGGGSAFRAADGSAFVAFHGWGADIGYDAGGQRSMFIAGLKLGELGPEAELDRTSVIPGSSVPFGRIDVVDVRDGRVTLQGWALDRDVFGPLPVHAYVNGRFVANERAGLLRPDVAAVFGTDPRRGFSITTDPGEICLYVINRPVGTNPLIGCRVAGLTPPIGNLDVVAPAPGGARVAGWTLDPDAVRTPTAVHVYVDGRLAADAIVASRTRPDVAAAFGADPARGFDVVVPMTAGRHDVCAYAINTGPGDHTLVGCRSITLDATPFGALDVVRPADGAWLVQGWALDPRAGTPTTVHVYVDGRFVATTIAAGTRTDVNAAYPAWDARRGYAVRVPAEPGARTVCTYAVGRESNALLGCADLPR